MLICLFISSPQCATLHIPNRNPKCLFVCFSLLSKRSHKKYTHYTRVITHQNSIVIIQSQLIITIISLAIMTIPHISSNWNENTPNVVKLFRTTWVAHSIKLWAMHLYSTFYKLQFCWMECTRSTITEATFLLSLQATIFPLTIVCFSDINFF